jgi:multicomponent Na+:H+ antiporter subunit D
VNVHQSAIPVLIVAAPLITAFVLPVLGWWKRAAVFPLTLAALVFTFGAAIAAAREVLANGPVQYFMGGWAPPWGIEYRIDHLGALMLLLVGFVTLLVGIYSKRSVLRELPDKEVPFYSVYLLLVSGLTRSEGARRWCRRSVTSFSERWGPPSTCWPSGICTARPAH